jgi:hypothetical protein
MGSVPVARWILAQGSWIPLFQTAWVSDRISILRIDGLRVVVYPNDHRPAHVHVIGNGREAVFFLNEPGGPSELRENFGFSTKEVRHIKNRLDANLNLLCDEWRRVHGEA